MKGVPLTIVGVAAAGFEGVEPGHSTDFWIPLQNRRELNAWGNPPGDDGKLYLQMPNVVVPADDWAAGSGSE